VAWYRDQFGDLMVGPSELDWSVAAMCDAIRRLAGSGVWDLMRAYAAIGDAVWRVTMLDAALVRYHPRGYDDALDGYSALGRLRVEETRAGLRLVRNRAGEAADLAEFIASSWAGPGPMRGSIQDWEWRWVPEPDCGSRAPVTRTWEVSRYRSYQTRLAGEAIGATFTRCEEFLTVAASGAVPTGRESRPAAG
jgi:hypothetical protein